MSYNISTWTTKKIANLKIPAQYLLIPGVTVSVQDISREVGYAVGRNVRINASGLCEGFEIQGDLGEDYIVTVSSISHFGEGSGNTIDIFCEILSHSTGELTAILVWERGDSISRLIADDGVVVNPEIEL